MLQHLGTSSSASFRTVEENEKNFSHRAPAFYNKRIKKHIKIMLGKIGVSFLTYGTLLCLRYLG